MKMHTKKVAALKAPGLAHPKRPNASHPHFKRPKMSVMGKSAFGTPGMAGGGAAAFPPDPAMMGGAPPNPDMGGGAAPMPPNAAPDNIGG